MKAAVYRLRERGVRLARPMEMVRGDLVLGEVERGDRKVLKAQLQQDGRDVLPPLVDARVSRISRHGMVIKGRELTSRVPGSSKAKVSSHLQTWWALVHTAESLNFYETEDPLDEDDKPFSAVPTLASVAEVPNRRPAWQVRNGSGG